MQASHKVSAVFDDPNLIGSAGLVPAMLLAESAGLHDLARGHLSVASANAAAKTTAIVAGMVTGADSIIDLDRLQITRVASAALVIRCRHSSSGRRFG